MKNAHAIVLTVAGVFLAGFCCGVQRSDLSPEAQAILPKEGSVTIAMVSGSTVKGTLQSENAEKVVIKYLKPGSAIPLTKTILKKNIKNMVIDDVAPLFAENLLLMRKEEDAGFPADRYKKVIALCDEFIAKCPAAPEEKEIAKFRAVCADSLVKIERGMKKIAGEWLPPVSASVKEFDLDNKKIEELKAKTEFTDPDKKAKIIEEIEKLTDHRRSVARGLPEMMQKRIPALIANKEFDEAVVETTAFLQFWVKEVMTSEGGVGSAADPVFKKMDFDYIVRTQNQIIEAYAKAGGGAEKPASVPKDDKMVFVPGGYFLMGRPDAKPSDPEYPMHIVYVSPFMIDKHELSNAEYRKFVDEMKATPRSDVEHPDSPPLKKHDAEGWKEESLNGDSQPVVGIDWFDAYAYAKWAGKRMPTEAEWEKAARGMDGRGFTWGTTDVNQVSGSFVPGRKLIASEIDRQRPPQLQQRPPSTGCSCVKEEEDLKPLPPTVLPVATWDVDKDLPPVALKAVEEGTLEWNKSFRGPYGTVHMSGNAAEWVNDWYDETYYRSSPTRDPQGPDKGPTRVFRGGSYLGEATELWAYWRGYHYYTGQGIYMKSRGRLYPRPAIGARCAKSLELFIPAAEPVPKKEDAK